MRELNQILSDINAEAEKLSALYKELALAKGMPVDTVDTVPYGGAMVFTVNSDSMSFEDYEFMRDMCDQLDSKGIFTVFCNSTDVRYSIYHTMQEYGKALDDAVADLRQEKQDILSSNVDTHNSRIIHSDK